MRLLFYQNEQITIHTSSTSCISFTTHRKLHSFSNTGRNIDRNDFLIPYNTLTATFRTFLCNNLPFSLAGWTSRLCLHLPKNGIRHPRNDPTAITGLTSCCAFVILSTRTITLVASNIFLYFNFLFNTGSHFFKCQLHLDTQVRSSIDARSSRRAKAAKTSEAAKMSTKQVAKLREDILHRHTSSIAAARCTAHTGMTKLVITLALLRIT